MLQWLSHVQGLIWQERYNWSSPTSAGSVSTSSTLSSRAPALRQHFYLYLLSDILAQAVAQSSIAFWFAETFGGFGESGSAEWPRGWTTPVIQAGSSAWSSFRGCDCGSGMQWRQPSAVCQFEGHRTLGKQRFCNSFSLRATRPMRWKGIFPTGSRQPPPAPQTTTTTTTSIPQLPRTGSNSGES